MFKIKSKILKKLSAGFMAGLCVFSMLGSSMSGVITANAASTSTENSAFPSADTVVAKAATLLGSPYTFGNRAIGTHTIRDSTLRCRCRRSTTLVSTVRDLCTTRSHSSAILQAVFRGITLCPLILLTG